MSSGIPARAKSSARRTSGECFRGKSADDDAGSDPRASPSVRARDVPRARASRSRRAVASSIAPRWRAGPPPRPPSASPRRTSRVRPDRSFVSTDPTPARTRRPSPPAHDEPPPSPRSGRVVTVTVPGDATVDDVRTSIADAMGHPGCRARVHVPGLAGEIAGAGAFRDHVPGPDPDANANAAPADPDGVFARLAVCGYARLRRKTRATHGASRPPDSPPRPPASGAPPPPGGSPGFRRRNYIREAPEEDDRRAGGPDPAAALDPLAVPVGGHRPKPALVLPLSDDEGEVVVTGAREAREARRRRDSGVPTREGGSAAAEELWSALDREAKAARRDADAETKNPPTFDPRLRTIAGGRAVPEAATAALVEAFMAEEAARRRGKAADGSAKARRKAPRGPGGSARRSKRAKPSRDEPEPECIGAEDASRDEAEPEAGAQDASDALDASGDGPNASGNRSNATPAADADALPAPLERLARLYEASARAAAFLASQRVRATWKHLEPLTRGAGVALGDLEAMAALAPGSASLSRRRALRRDEARDDGVSGGGERAFGAGRGGDGGDEIDEILVDLTVPGTARVRLAAGLGGDTPAPPCDEDERSPEPADEPLATVVHGSRPGARTYDAGSSEDDVHEDAPRDDAGGEKEKAARGCSNPPRGSRPSQTAGSSRARLWGRAGAGSRLGERRRSAPSSLPSRRARGTTVPARARNPTKPPRTTTRGAKKKTAAGLPNGRANGRRTNGKHPKPPPPVSTRTSRSPPPSANAAPRGGANGNARRAPALEPSRRRRPPVRLRRRPRRPRRRFFVPPPRPRPGGLGVVRAPPWTRWGFSRTSPRAPPRWRTSAGSGGAWPLASRFRRAPVASRTLGRSRGFGTRRCPR